MPPWLDMQPAGPPLRSRGARSWSFWLVLLLGWVWVAHPTLALDGASDRAPIRLDDRGYQRLWQGVGVLADPTGTLKLADVINQDRAGNFKPLPMPVTSLGHRGGGSGCGSRC